jgi:hypothetical protein
MGKLQLTDDADAGAAPTPGERELKFTVPAGRVDAARRWLDALCRRDPQFPAAIVWTLYYDTPDLTALGEKINSEYLKRKVRLRWYSPVGGGPAGPAFIEAKTRTGTRRAKLRVPVPCDAEDVARWNLQDPRLAAFPQLLRDGPGVVQDLRPVVLLRYRRDRFVEPVSGARVSLDAEITPVKVNQRFLSVPDDRALDTAVLEVKGLHDELPPRLQPLLRLGARKCSFSKFLAIYLRAIRSNL